MADKPSKGPGRCRRRVHRAERHRRPGRSPVLPRLRHPPARRVRDLRGDRLPAAARVARQPRRAGRLPRRARRPGRALGTLVSPRCRRSPASQGPMEAMRSLVSLASADDPDKDSNAAGGRTPARPPGSPRSSRSWSAAYHAARTGRPMRAGRSRVSAWRRTSCSRCTGRLPSEREAADPRHLPGAARGPHDERVDVRGAGMRRDPVRHALGGGRRDWHAQGPAARRRQRAGDARPRVDPVHARLTRSPRPAPASGRLGAGEKIMGFGHRVYKTEDPRATHLREMSGGTRRRHGRRHLLPDVPADGGGRLRGEGPLSECGLLRGHGLPLSGHPDGPFTPVFSVSRMAGWTAHVIEQHADNRLIRPDSEYIGERDLTWVALSGR